MKELREIKKISQIKSEARENQVPIIMDADIGHFAPMMPLICGSYASISVKGNEIAIEMQ